MDRELSNLRDLVGSAPSPLRDSLVNDPVTDEIVSYMRANPLADLKDLVEWYIMRMREEVPNFNPREKDPSDSTIKIAIAVAAYKMDSEDKASVKRKRLH